MELDRNKDFDNQVKKKFDEFLSEVPSALWNGIAKEIRTETSIDSKSLNHKLVHPDSGHSDSVDLDMKGNQINDPTGISEPKVRNIDQEIKVTNADHEIKVRSIDREIRNIDRSFKFKRFIGIAASFLIIGFAVWKFQPEEKVFLRGSEALTKTTDSEKRETDSEKLVSKVERGDSRLIAQNQARKNRISVSEAHGVEDVKIAVSSKANEGGSHGELPIKDKVASYPDNATGITNTRPISKRDVELRELASNASSKSITLSKNGSLSESGNTSLASSSPSRLKSAAFESVDNNQELAIQETNASYIPDVINDDMLSNTEAYSSTSTEDQNLIKKEPKEKQRIVSSVLNFLVNNIQIGGDSVVEFSETENGIIKVDLKGIFARNNR